MFSSLEQLRKLPLLYERHLINSGTPNPGWGKHRKLEKTVSNFSVLSCLTVQSWNLSTKVNQLAFPLSLQAFFLKHWVSFLITILSLTRESKTLGTLYPFFSSFPCYNDEVSNEDSFIYLKQAFSHSSRSWKPEIEWAHQFDLLGGLGTVGIMTRVYAGTTVQFQRLKPETKTGVAFILEWSHSLEKWQGGCPMRTTLIPSMGLNPSCSQWSVLFL